MKHILIILLLIFVTYVKAEGFNKKEFEKVIKTIKKTSLYKLSDSEIYEGAIKGVLLKLEEKNKLANKKFAHKLLPPQVKNEINIHKRGEVTGIGVTVRFDKRLRDRYPIVTRVLDGGAKEAGVKAGDEIVKIGKMVIGKNKNITDLLQVIRGKVGSKIKLSFLRNGEIFIKEIIRKKIPYKSVNLSFPKPKLGLLRIKFFNDKTYKETKKALEQMKKKKVSGCMLDLRSNQGGHYKQGLKTLELFVKKGDELFNIEKNNGKHQIVKARKDGIHLNCKWAILVDKETKSFGEVFTNALRKLKHATIIGNSTYGKTSMESILPLKNGYAVKYTVGKIHGVKGESWEGKGLRPDIYINFDNSHGFKEQYLVNSAINFLIK